MKTNKRLTALALMLVFALTSLVSITGFASEFSDVAETNVYYEAITSLVDEGVVNGYEDGTFKPDATITRAEFSKLLAVASAPAGTQFSATTTQFSDIADSTSSSAWAIPYVAYAVGTKAVNGYEDGTFRPTNPVTYGEAIKMIVCTLGYGSVVDTTLTPWYQGYINIAMQIGLTKGAMSVGDNPAPRGLVAQLIYNMRNCKQLVQSGTDSQGNPSYSIDDGSYDNTDSDEGVLLGVFDYCLTSDSITKSQVLIDNDVYQIGDLDKEDLQELVGYAVSFKYIKGNKPELTKVSRISGENDIFEIEDWQIATVSDSEIEYYEDEDAEYEDEVSTLKFASDLYVVYNGVVVPEGDIDGDFIKNYLNVKNGKVTLLSNDGNDKNVEVAFVESYLTYFVNTSSTTNGVTTIRDKYPTHSGLDALALDEDDVTSVEKITKEGGTFSNVSLTGITSKSVTSVAIPYGTKEGTKVKISTATVTGSVKEIKNDYSTVKIGTKSYEFAPYYLMLLENEEGFELDINDGGKFYLDYLGRIVYFEKTESTNPYALIVEYKTGSSMDSAIRVNILNSSKGLNAFTLKDDVRVNGKSMSAEEAIAYLKGTAPNYDDEKPSYIIQPIKYKTSTSNGKTVISEIECMDSTDYEDGNIVPYKIANSVNTDKEYFANNGSLTYDRTGYSFKNGSSIQFRMNSSTVVFLVPSDITKADSFSKKTYSYFSNGNFKVEPYDMNGEVAKLVVCYGSSTTPSIYANTPSYFIQEISDKNNSEGQPTKNIKYYKAGTTEVSEMLVANETAVLDKFDDIQPGDLVKFVSEDSEIIDVKVIYSAGELTNETGTFKIDGRHLVKAYDGDNDYYQVLYGTTRSVEIDGEVKSISVIPHLAEDDDFNPDENYVAFTQNALKDTVYYKYNEKNGIEITDAGIILPYMDYVDGDDHELAKETATQIVAVVYDDEVVAVYILGE